MENFYSVSLNLKNKKVTVVGGGTVAERKIKSLLKAGAVIEVISLEVTEFIKKADENKELSFKQGFYDDKDLDNSLLVIAATSDRKTNNRISEYCNEHNILVNVIDCLEESSFVVNSVVDRGNLKISISTSGKSPALSKTIRKDLEERYGREYELLTELLGEIRLLVKEQIDSQDKRQAFYYRVIGDEILDLLRDGQLDKASERVKSWLSCY